MKSRSKQPSAFRWIINERGAAALISIVVVMALVVLVVTSVALAGLSTLEHGFAEQVSTDIILADETCAEEAIVRLQRNSAYTGGSLTVGDVACTITVSGSGSTRTITIVGVEQNFTRRLQADISLSGSVSTITAWQETD
jgi:hypothetical protein